MHLLVAEDDVRLAHLLERGLKSEGHVVDLAHDGDEALVMGLEAHFDALVLDVMMPGIDGVEVVRRLRDRRVMTPILLLTARDEVEDRVRGLDSGADDYLVKPFAFDELLARIRALSRRRGATEETILRSGEIEVDLLRHEVRLRGAAVEFSPTEFRLLEFLIRHAGEALSRRRILAHVWGYDDEPDANAVDLYVHYLRRKLGNSFRLQTVRGVGYRLDEPAV